jgi:hypothetical protein
LGNLCVWAAEGGGVRRGLRGKTHTFSIKLEISEPKGITAAGTVPRTEDETMESWKCSVHTGHKSTVRQQTFFHEISSELIQLRE